ncbi:MAG: fluoride efflux transporter CrcB [Pseudomonadota bacterium]|nr:fluoride efflux transporter CrcB [Rhodospirillaceae bacterium]MBO90730.1 fluoride efflux transporter CrcB [Rhodospirillaceae bacterium]MEC7972728.1 fluoride efflux transporter CrcB [Pseudomonadota bacterium]|tara:strand:+ start:306 stop:686 length:381 start_codon:yes stop_codon:yes gene_type:complete
MKIILMVAIGGAIGAIARQQSNQLIMRIFGGEFPIGTIFVNILGSFIMGLLFELFATKITLSDEWRSLIFTGVLASFTTFSSFALDVALLSERNEYYYALCYIGMSVVLSIGALFVGLWVMRGLLT